MESKNIMTFELLSKIIEKNNIPKDVKLMSDSGCECNETEMNGIFYNKDKNVLIFTQNGDQYDSEFEKDGFVCIHGELKDFRDKHGYDYYECDCVLCCNNLDGVCYRGYLTKELKNACQYNTTNAMEE